MVILYKHLVLYVFESEINLSNLSGYSKLFTDVLETFSYALDVPKIYPWYNKDTPVGLVGLVVLVGLVGLCRSGGVGWSCGFGCSSVPTYHITVDFLYFIGTFKQKYGL